MLRVSLKKKIESKRGAYSDSLNTFLLILNMILGLNVFAIVLIY